MRKRLMMWAAALAMLAVPSTSFAADHTDSPLVIEDPTADINDVFVFRATDPAITGNTKRTVMIMTVVPFATGESKFSDAVNYDFMFRGNSSGDQVLARCWYIEADSMVKCDINGDEVTTTVGAVDDGNPNNGGTKLYAGLTDDPFFFDLEAFSLATTGDPTGFVDGTGSDTFAGANVLSITIEIDNDKLPADDSGLSFWARTARRVNQ